MTAVMPMSVDVSKASELVTVHTPQADRLDRSTRSPDSGYASTTPTPEGTPQCDKGEVEFSTGKYLKRKIRLKVFQEEIPKHVKDRFLDLQELFDRPLYERLISSGKSFGPISSKLKRLGESEETSAYWLVIQCEPRMARRIRQFFDQDHVKSEYQPRNKSAGLPWFNIWVCPQPPTQLAMDNEVDGDIFLDLKERTLCGTLVMVPGGVATIGGVIMVKAHGEESLYCLTAGHIMSTASSLHGVRDARGKEEQDLSDVESEARLSNDEVELCSVPVDDSQTGQNLSISRIDLLQPRPISFVEGTQDSTKRCFDWALAALHQADLYRPNCRIRTDRDHGDHATVTTVESDELRETAQRSTRLAVSRRVVVLGGMSGFKSGHLSGSPSSYMSGPSARFAQMYTLTLTASSALEVGDCGSWIVDEATNEVYGHVVASDIFGEVYIAPLKETLKEVEEVLRADSVSLPTRSEVAAWIEVHTTHVAYDSVTLAADSDGDESTHKLEENQVLPESASDFASYPAYRSQVPPTSEQLKYSGPQNPAPDSAYGSKVPSPPQRLGEFTDPGPQDTTPDSAYGSQYPSPSRPGQFSGSQNTTPDSWYDLPHTQGPPESFMRTELSQDKHQGGLVEQVGTNTPLKNLPHTQGPPESFMRTELSQDKHQGGLVEQVGTNTPLKSSHIKYSSKGSKSRIKSIVFGLLRRRS